MTYIYALIAIAALLAGMFFFGGCSPDKQNEATVEETVIEETDPEAVEEEEDEPEKPDDPVEIPEDDPEDFDPSENLEPMVYGPPEMMD